MIHLVSTTKYHAGSLASLQHESLSIRRGSSNPPPENSSGIWLNFIHYSVLAEDDGYDGNEDPRVQKQSIIVVCTPGGPLADPDVRWTRAPLSTRAAQRWLLHSYESGRCSGHWKTRAGVLHTHSFFRNAGRHPRKSWAGAQPLAQDAQR